ncbi:hypothetical protein CTAM01_07002 [Colletotrichum tamarilloi]|uniref:Uncharacterized protein n=1 Tax=Colletotrichum tamarilloi TaxID=1209934 RepID=A0ABQ9R9N4_9PEZI|nr:uncharacterized protein CTAM01_07002 [Colletotrichum tamarilloi]KAK1499081.1 hypothetical protein CTAM01_07002 [Colletotrichum tamarilloi]
MKQKNQDALPDCAENEDPRWYAHANTAEAWDPPWWKSHGSGPVGAPHHVRGHLWDRDGQRGRSLARVFEGYPAILRSPGTAFRQTLKAWPSGQICQGTVSVFPEHVIASRAK